MPNSLAQRMARYRKRRRAGCKPVISEGDSWFSYEFFPNIIDLIDKRETFAHLRLEMSGDTVENMIGNAESRKSLRDLAREEHAIFLLFSGGGNDMQRASDRGLFRNADDPAECLIPERAEKLFSDIKARYERMIQVVGPTVPIAGHGYDWFQPIDEPVRLAGMDIKIGPWFHPNMVSAGIEDPQKQRAVADLLVDRFNADLADLEARYPNDFVHMDLRGTLDPATDWENEIHPTRDGFVKVADKIWEQIDTRVRALVEQRSWED